VSRQCLHAAAAAAAVIHRGQLTARPCESRRHDVVPAFARGRPVSLQAGPTLSRCGARPTSSSALRRPGMPGHSTRASDAPAPSAGTCFADETREHPLRARGQVALLAPLLTLLFASQPRSPGSLAVEGKHLHLQRHAHPVRSMSHVTNVTRNRFVSGRKRTAGPCNRRGGMQHLAVGLERSTQSNPPLRRELRSVTTSSWSRERGIAASSGAPVSARRNCPSCRPVTARR